MVGGFAWCAWAGFSADPPGPAKTSQGYKSPLPCITPQTPKMQHDLAQLLQLAAQNIAQLAYFPGLLGKAVQPLPDDPQAAADRGGRQAHLLRDGGYRQAIGIAQPGKLLLSRGKAAGAAVLQQPAQGQPFLTGAALLPCKIPAWRY